MMFRLIKMLFIFTLPLQMVSCDHHSGAAVDSTEVVSEASETAQLSPPVETERPASTLPRLVDVGANRCIPCMMMAPILEHLREEYQEIVEVEIFDLTVTPQAADTFGVRIIPTQIFYDAQGQEVLRHQGFMSREDILAQFKTMGIPEPSGQEE